MPWLHYQYSLRRLWHRVYNLRLSHPDEYIIIYKDNLVSAFRRLCYHPNVTAAYAFVLGAYLVIPVVMVFVSRDPPSLFCLISELRSFTSRVVRHLPLSCPKTSMIGRFRFPHAPPSSRDTNPDHKYPGNKGVEGTNLGPHPTFVDDTTMAEFRSLIRQSVENSILTASVFVDNSNIVK